MYQKHVKRLLDIACSMIVLICFWWLLLIIAILVKTKLGSPIIFTQDRPGENGKIFKLYKFRSMSNETDNKGNLLPDSQRLTRFGKILRSTSMDELPELFNILKGDMSIVGPRPLLVKYLNYYNEYEMARHNVRPGLTGLAQVSGRNSLTWKDRFEKDLEYVENASLLMDLKIIMRTIKKIIIKEGIEFKKTESIMDYFNGTNRCSGTIR
ncbi:MAG: sugar transferase [Lachnospiraceae bacterium]|nr:sugar transferase [Lachnospiraceae bacterium]